MAFEVGTASSPADLLTKLATFAAANGWTVNTPVSGTVFEKGSIFVGMSTDADELFMRGALSYDGGLAWNAQPNNAGITAACNLGAGPYTEYTFYATAEAGKDMLAAAVEVSAGVFRHLLVCDLIKYGAWTGGTYVDSTFLNTSSSNINFPDSSAHRYICDANTADSGPDDAHVWIDYDGKTDNWQQLLTAASLSADRCTGSLRTNGLGYQASAIGWARWNLRAVPQPLELYANRPSSLRSPIGRVPNMRAVNMTNYVPGELVTIGTDLWQFFPVFQNTATSNANPSTTPSSGRWGYAYKRV